MKIIIPYIFKSGKRAVASEVNTNFQTCADGIEQVAEELENVKDVVTTKASVTFRDWTVS